jgi:hypothetical protein
MRGPWLAALLGMSWIAAAPTAGSSQPAVVGQTRVAETAERLGTSGVGARARDEALRLENESALFRARSTAWPGGPQPAKGGDSVLNGILIGAAVGGLLGLIPDYYDDCEECHDSLYASIAVGAGIGLLVDLLRDRRQAPSPSETRDGLHVDVAIRRRTVGMGWRLAWR